MPFVKDKPKYPVTNQNLGQEKIIKISSLSSNYGSNNSDDHVEDDNTNIS